MNAGQVAALVASSAGAGVMNAMAGGGTILTYPTLLFLGESAITANATSTVALWPGAASSMYGYRREVAENKEWLKTLFLPSLLGGAIGAILLLKTPVRSFQRLAPFLILFATVLFMLQGVVARWAGSAEKKSGRRGTGHWTAAWLYQLGVGIYGGYFGAGIGIMMLAGLALAGFAAIHRAIALRNYYAILINGIAAVYFICFGAVRWSDAAVLTVGQVLGSAVGARVAHGLPATTVRWVVVGIGAAMALGLMR